MCLVVMLMLRVILLICSLMFGWLVFCLIVCVE